MSKRVSVPDFEEMLAVKPVNVNEAIGSETEDTSVYFDNVAPAVKTDKARSLDIYSQFSSAPSSEEKPSKYTPISELLTTMFKSPKPEPEPIAEVKNNVNSIVENLQYIENAKKTTGVDNIRANFEVVEQTIAPDVIDGIYTPDSNVNEETIFEEYPKLAQPLNEEQAIKMVKNLKLWATDIDLNIESFPEYDNYFYVARQNSMAKIGNSYIVDKSTGKIYIVSASMPETMSFKKVINNVIKPAG